MGGIFGRRVELSFGQAGQTGIALPDLRTSFLVKMNKGSNAHSASIQLYNPSDISIAALEAGIRPTVQLKVGYGDPELPDGGLGLPRTIFIGEIVKDGLRIEREGTDRIVSIEAQDTPGAYQLARVALTFATPVNMTTVVTAIASSLAIPVGTILLGAGDVTLTQGGTFTGAARDVLDRIAATVNGRWWISDGVFNFLPDGVPLPGTAPQFSATTGNLVGIPIKKDRGGIEIKGLLDASMRPGLPFVVQSTKINGTYIATDVEFIGDSGFDTPFYVRVIGKAF